MLMILEIILTVKAWKKGWKGLALIPLGIALVIGFLVGASLQASGGKLENVWVLCVLGDLLAIAVLGGMCATAPSRASAAASTHVERTGSLASLPTGNLEAVPAAVAPAATPAQAMVA